MCAQMARAWQHVWRVLGFIALFCMGREAVAASDDPEPLIFVEEGRMIYWAKLSCDTSPKNIGSHEQHACIDPNLHVSNFVQRLKIQFATNPQCKGVTVTFTEPKDQTHWRLWVNFVPWASGQDWGLDQSSRRYPNYFQRQGTISEMAAAACGIALGRGAKLR